MNMATGIVKAAFTNGDRDSYDDNSGIISFCMGQKYIISFPILRYSTDYKKQGCIKFRFEWKNSLQREKIG